MIEISHKQAQRWLRQKLDHHLPDAQWSTLQGHLETCSECRAYRDQLGVFERDIKRALRSGWDSAEFHISGEYTTEVIRQRKAAAVNRRRITWTTAVFLLGLAFILTGGLERLRNRGQPQSVIEVTPTPSPLPTPAAGEFRGIVAFEAIAGSQSDIFLLNYGEPGGPVNLTDHPARDTSPAWSPDGEWLAFLSDRASESGQLEVFVTNVVGSRVIQLTSAPEMLWEGPISWSSDGKRLALTGIRLGQGGQSRIYIVPLDGNSSDSATGSNATGSASGGGQIASGAYSLPGTRGGYAPEFAPFGDRLAFAFSDGSRGGVMITHLDGRERASTNWVESRSALPTSPGSSLEWSPDGNSLAYTASALPDEGSGEGAEAVGLEGAQVMTVRDLNFSITLFSDFRRSFNVAQSRWPGAFRAVGWTPGGSVMYVEDLDDARAADEPGAISGCWRIYTRSTGNGDDDGTAFLQGGLCVESGLDRASWTPDGEWLVMLGRTIPEMQTGAPRGLYALQLAGSFGPDQEPREMRIVRLGDTEGITGMPLVRPALKRFQRPLNINPQPVVPQAEALGLPEPSAAPGEVLFARPQGAGSVIVKMSPDGTGGMLLHATEEIARCPAFSPDGSQIVFVSGPKTPSEERLSATPEPDLPSSASPDFYPVDTGLPGEDIYVMRRDGSNLARISRAVAGGGKPQGAARYACPTWSPDGRWLAAPLETSDGWYLAVVPARGGAARATAIGRPAGSTGPRWTPDSSRVLLTHTPAGGNQWPVISAIDLPAATSAALERRDLRTLSGWRSVSGMAVLPEGKVTQEAANRTADAWQIGLIAQYAGTDGNMRSVLRRLSMSNSSEREVVVLGADYPQGFSGAPLGIGSSESSESVYMRSLALQRGGMLAWQAENGLGMILRGGPGTDKKTVIHFYDIDTRSLSEITALDDVLYGAAWSPDGNWIILSTESGLWLVDVQAARTGRAAPLWISPEPVFDLDWGN